MSKIAQQVQEAEDQINWHWRNSMRVIRFFTFDARAAWPIPILIFYFRPSTIFLTVVNLLFFRFLERKGLTFNAAMRAFRCEVVAAIWGPERPGLVGAYHRKFKDYG